MRIGTYHHRLPVHRLVVDDLRVRAVLVQVLVQHPPLVEARLVHAQRSALHGISLADRSTADRARP